MNLRDLLLDGLKDIYWAEKALVKALPNMARSSTSRYLVDALQGHLEETRNQVTRLEDVFVLLDEKVSAKKCVAMEGLINEAEHILEETGPGAVRDAGIIAATQKIEHYEIVSYSTMATFAKTLGEDDAASILLEIMEEEKEVDKYFSELAETFVNDQAHDPDDEDEEDELDEEEDEEEEEEDYDRDTEDEDE